MKFGNTKLVLGVIIIGLLYYIVRDNDNDNEKCKKVEYFDEALNDVVKEKDYIKEWDNEFPQAYKSAGLKEVHPLSEHETTFADFTSSGKNLYNNLTHFDSADLLPKPDKQVPSDHGWSYKHGANWDESNPQIKHVEGNAWLNERKFLGMYSVGSSLRNATHDIRRDVPNPQMTVSPWNNTTIMPDSNSKGLCSF